MWTEEDRRREVEKLREDYPEAEIHPYLTVAQAQKLRSELSEQKKNLLTANKPSPFENKSPSQQENPFREKNPFEIDKPDRKDPFSKR